MTEEDDSVFLLLDEAFLLELDGDAGTESGMTEEDERVEHDEDDFVSSSSIT